MQLRSLRFALPLLAAPMLSCGLTVQDFDGKVRVNFVITGDNASYADEFVVNTDSNTDVRDNRDKIKEGSGKIREIRIEVASLESNNTAAIAWGEVYMRKAGSMEAWPTESPDNALALFTAVPLVPGQNFKLDISPAKRAAIAKFVFDKNNTQIDVKIRGWTDTGPVAFSAAVIFHVEFTAGL